MPTNEPTLQEMIDQMAAKRDALPPPAAQGEKSSISPKLKKEEISKATLGQVEQLEGELFSLIDTAPEIVQSDLKEQAREDKKIADSTSIYMLDDSNKGWKFGSQGKSFDGLNDYQNKSKEFFEKTLTTHKIEGVIATNIIKALAQLQNARQLLLAKALEDQSVAKSAFFELKAAMEGLPDDIVDAKAEGAKDTSNSFMALLNAQENHTLTGTDPVTKKQHYIHLEGDSLVSDDPIILGKAMAAAGYKSIVVSGGPLKALATARAAHAAGVLNVTFDDATRDAIHNPAAYPSYYDREKAVAEYNAIIKINTANKDAKMAEKNTIKNAQQPQDPNRRMINKARVFNLIHPDGPAHAEMLRSMPMADVATLARLLEDKSFDIKGMRLNGQEYIRWLVRNFPNTDENKTKTFEAESTKEEVVLTQHAIQQLKLDEKGKRDPLHVADIISQNNGDARTLLYKDEHNQINLTVEEKAVLLSKIFDRFHISIKQNPKPFPGGKDHGAEAKNEMKALLASSTQEEATQILAIFNSDYNRAASKVRQLDPGSSKDLKKIYEKNAAFAGYNEIQGVPTPMLTDQSSFNLYCKLLGTLKIAVKELAIIPPGNQEELEVSDRRPGWVQNGNSGVRNSNPVQAEAEEEEEENEEDPLNNPHQNNEEDTSSNPNLNEDDNNPSNYRP
ncbi:MAG: hypothetical protein H0U71_02845 [Gammaproteobacteria bacterium]|nr:hypothetical protein [Gammaproteobacteria bacterium]